MDAGFVDLLPLDSCGKNGNCDCNELRLCGKRVDPPPFHNCSYVRARNELIPQAMQIASQKIGDAVSKRAKWTRCFSDTMDELAKPLLNGANGPRR
jgi:hypothetical protein